MSDELVPGTGTVVPDAPIVDAPVVDNTDSALGDAYDRLTREVVRDEHGRFAPTNPPVIASPDNATGVQDDGAQGAADAPPVVAGTLAPAHLPQAIKAHWDKYGPEGQAAIAAHQSEMDRKFGEIGKQYGLVKPFADTLAQATQKFPEFAGMNPTELAQAALQLAAVQADMNKNPVGTIMEIVQTYGVADQLKAILTGQEYTQPANQGTAALEREIAGLKNELRKVSNPDFVGEQISRTMKEKDAETITQEFIASDGKDHWADVEATLPTFIKLVLDQGGQKTQKQVLSEAYNMAINAIPEVRAKVRAAEAKATAVVPDPRRADAARKAVSINIKPVANGKDAPRSDEEAMSMAYDRAMAN